MSECEDLCSILYSLYKLNSYLYFRTCKATLKQASTLKEASCKDRCASSFCFHPCTLNRLKSLNRNVCIYLSSAQLETNFIGISILSDVSSPFVSVPQTPHVSSPSVSASWAPQKLNKQTPECKIPV